jgi:hypothetical protein
MNTKSTIDNIRIYSAFESCVIHVEGQTKRGIRARCSRCERSEKIMSNTNRGSGGGHDEDVIERSLRDRFEKLGWKIGKNADYNLCPEHAVKEKIIMTNKQPTDKIVLMSSAATPPPRSPTRDEKRIIFQKIDEVYVGETVGYSKAWSDDVVAKDLNVPVAWVATIREENFGPNIDEASAQVITDARALLADVKLTIQAWNVRADQIEKAIAGLRK